MKYSEFVKVYEALDSTTKKLAKTEILANFLIRLKGKEELVYLLKGRVFPDYDERELGISTQLAIKAIAKAAGTSAEEISHQFKRIGDLGDIAESFTGKKKQSTLFAKSLEVSKVFENLRKVVEIEGKGAIDKKLNFVVELLTSASGKEAKYIMRTVLNDLRIGVADGILRDAIAHAFFGAKNVSEIRDIIEEAYDKVNDFAELMKLAEKGKESLETIEVVPGKPIKVMLPIKVADIEEAFRICGKTLAIEHKYDGFRVVINKEDNGKIKLYTRRLDNITNQFPDIVAVVKKQVKASSFVLDSEVVGLDPKTKKYRPFEAMSQRIKRKYNIDKLISELPIEINVFDILYCNGKSVINLPFKKRRKLLEKVIIEEQFKIRLAKQFISNNKKEIMKFYRDALKTGEEGVMFKNLDAPYKPGRRVGYMVKMKPEVADLDLVIVGAEHGTGKRAGALTSYILACRHGNEFLEVGKVSSGLKEKEEEGTTYSEMNKLLQPLIIKETKEGVIVKPQVIVSVTYQNIQPSPKYKSGFALRFPRITHYRPERGIYDIASLDDIKRDVKLMQKRVGREGKRSN